MSEDAPVQEIQEVRVDVANLYREEVYTDLRVATIRVLVPVKQDGTQDPSRETLFSGQTTLLSQAGPLPVECPIEAKNLQEAAANRVSSSELRSAPSLRARRKTPGLP